MDVLLVPLCLIMVEVADEAKHEVHFLGRLGQGFDKLASCVRPAANESHILMSSFVRDIRVIAVGL